MNKEDSIAIRLPNGVAETLLRIDQLQRQQALIQARIDLLTKEIDATLLAHRNAPSPPPRG